MNQPGTTLVVKCSYIQSFSVGMYNSVEQCALTATMSSRCRHDEWANKQKK